jgi:hypothetical protein
MALQAMAVLLVLANIGSGLTGQVGRHDYSSDARLYYHGRCYHLDPNTILYRNIWTGILAFLDRSSRLRLTAQVLNFGAFLGFMG